MTNERSSIGFVHMKLSEGNTLFFHKAVFSTLMCILALFSKLRVVCLVLSGPKGTSFFNCSKYSRSLARLQTHRRKMSQHTSTSRK